MSSNRRRAAGRVQQPTGRRRDGAKAGPGAPAVRGDGRGDLVERDDPEAPEAAAALYGSNTMCVVTASRFHVLIAAIA